MSRRRTRRPLGSWLLGAVLSGLAVVLLSRLVSGEDLQAAFAAVDYRYLVPVTILYFISYFSRAWAWQFLLNHQASFRQVILALGEGYLLNNLLPFRLGELGRAVLLAGAAGLSAMQVLSTIVIERAYDVAIAAGLLLATLPFALGMAWARPVALAALGLVIAGLLALYLAARFRERIEAYITNRAQGKKILTVLAPPLNAFLEGLSALTDLKRFAISLGLILVAWAAGITETYLLMIAVVGKTAYWWAAFTIGTLGLGLALPSAPASLGIFEAAVVAPLTLVGVNAAAALAVAVILHLVQIVYSGIFGVIGLAQSGENLLSVYRRLRSSPAGNGEQ